MDKIIPDYFDLDSPDSMVNKLPASVSTIMVQHRSEIIRGLVKLPKNFVPTKNVNLLRKNMWVEYENAVADNRVMILPALIRGVCSSTEYYETISYGYNWAWMLRPLTSYKDALEETLSIGLEKLREAIANIDVIGDDGKTNIQGARLLLSAIKMVDDRLNGQPEENIRIKSINMHSKADELFYDAEKTMKQLELDAKEDFKEELPATASPRVLEYLMKVNEKKDKKE